MSSVRRAGLAPLIYGAAALGSFLAFAMIGSASASRGARVLGGLDRVVSSVKVGGLVCLEWLWGHPKTVGVVVTVLAAAIGLAGAFLTRLRSRPLLLLMIAITLATWGQLVLLRKGPVSAGVFLYLGGILCAAVVGRLHPISRLTGFPSLPSPAESPPDSRDTRPGPSPLEWAGVLGLTLLGLLFRGYALTEYPTFDGESTQMLVNSYTGFGIRYYLMNEFLGTGNGMFHVAAQYVLYRLFGATIFTTYLVALFWGVVAIPLLYWLARRIAGRGAAIVATILFIAAPEQLFWSRTDNNFFTTVSVVALVTAHLGLSMQERFAPRAVLASALWMPFCRYAYTPSWVLFTLPVLLAVHAAVFVRGAFRRLRYAAPLLAGGFLLWLFSLSAVEFALQPGNGWRFVNPATVRGEAAWRQDIRKDAGPLEVLRKQGARVTRNAGFVLAGMTYNTKYTSAWYERYVADGDRNTMITAGLAVLCALGIGYLLGQLQGRRAALLLIWIAIGLLPGCLSDEPEARRISIVFPALPIVAGVFVMASVRLAREAAGRRVARATAAALGVAAVLTAFLSLLSNLLLGTRPLELQAEMRFAAPLFERCDMVLHSNLDRANTIVDIGVLDALIRRRPDHCSQLVERKDWPAAALDPRCDFTDFVFELTLSPQEKERRRRSYRPTRIGYLILETPENRDHIELLRRLFPAARTEEFREPNSRDRFFTMEVPISAIEALHSPEVSAESAEAAARVKTSLLEGTELAVGSPAAPGITIRGGLLLPEQDWYLFRLEPECPKAKLTVGSPSSASREPRPLLAGVHPFVIRLGTAAGCRLPLRLAVESARRPGLTVPTMLLAPRVASETEAAAVVAVPGYGESRVFARLKDHPVDVGVDGTGNIFVLGHGQEGWSLHRFAPDGTEEAVTRTQLPRRENSASLSVDTEGTCVLASLFSVEVRDRSGQRVQSWNAPFHRPPSDVAWLPDGRILFCLPDQDSMQILSRDGRVEGSFTPAGERLVVPMGVAISPDGTILVMEKTGRARVFRTPAGRWAPVPVATFPVAYPEMPYPPDLAACAFDGANQVLFPHHSLPAPLVYDLEGRRLMASVPGRDLSAKGLNEALGACATGDALYVLDSNPPAVIRVARP